MNLLNAREYIEGLLKIRTKDGRMVPLKLNPPQQRLSEAVRKQWRAKKPVRIIILKARQMGFSTLTEALIFWRTATAPYTESMVVAHKEDATANLFRMLKLYLDALPDMLKPMTRASNAQEIDFNRPARYRTDQEGLHSRIRCATAGGEGVGRSYTLQCLHLSEFAFWPGDKLKTFVGLAQAVPDLPGTMIIIESTANGYETFKTMWDQAVEAKRSGQEGVEPVFFPWYEMPEYRRDPPPGFVRTAEETELAEEFGLDDAQIAWRRWCIQTLCGGDMAMFRQEYPATPDEAFISTGSCFFPQEELVKRRESDNSGGREKIAYHLTKKGKDALKTWLKEERVSNELKYETLLKLYFGGVEDRSVAIRNIGLFEENIRQNLEVLKIYRSNLEKVLDEEDHLYYYLTATFGVDVYEAYLKWCEKAKAMLK